MGTQIIKYNPEKKHASFIPRRECGNYPGVTIPGIANSNYNNAIFVSLDGWSILSRFFLVTIDPVFASIKI